MADTKVDMVKVRREVREIKAGFDSKVRALALTFDERMVLAMAVGDAIDRGVPRMRGCWPTPDDMRLLKRMSRRLWTSIGVKW